MTTKCSNLLLGLDGGGTKTDAVLSDEKGKVIARAVSGASGFTGISPEEAKAHLTEALQSVLEPAGGLKAELSGVYAGIAGCGLPAIQQRYQEFLTETLPGAKRVLAGSDAVNALNAGAGVGEGIIAIAGTGAVIYYRKDGKMTRVSGWGYLLGDEGSGFDLGQRALAAALRALDGRGQATALIPLLEKHAGCPLSEWVSSIYAGDAKALIASAAPLLLQAAESGDSVGRTELNASAAGMAQAIMCAVDRCPVQSVVLGGSVWKSRLYTEIVLKHLRDGITLIYPSVPPVFGAVLQAAETAGIPAGKDFQDNLRQGLT